MTTTVAPAAGRLTYTLAELAVITGIPERTIRDLLAHGELGVPRLPNTGRRIYFSRAEVEAWLSAGTTSTVRP